MKLKELKEWLDTLPDEFLEYDVCNGETGELDGEHTYRVDKPILAMTVDEENEEVIFFHKEQEK